MPEIIYCKDIDTLFIRLAGFGCLHVAYPLADDVYALVEPETGEIVGIQIENWKGRMMDDFERWGAKQMQNPEFRAEVKRLEPSYQRIRRRVLRRLKWQRRLAAWKQRLFLQA